MVLERHYSTSAAIRREYLCLPLTILGALLLSCRHNSSVMKYWNIPNIDCIILKISLTVDPFHFGIVNIKVLVNIIRYIFGRELGEILKQNLLNSYF